MVTTAVTGPESYYAEKALLSDSGQVVFTARPSPSDSENGIFVYTPGVGFDTIVQNGDVLPKAGVLQGVTPEFSTNALGQVAFKAGVESGVPLRFTNGDFSQGTGDTFDGWTVVGDAGSIVETASGGVDDSRAIRFNLASNPGNSTTSSTVTEPYIEQSFPVEADLRIELQASAVNNVSGNIGAEFRASSDVFFDSRSLFFSGSAFSPLSNLIDSDGSGVLRIGKLFGFTSDDIIIDNVEIFIRPYNDTNALFFYDGSTLHEVGLIGTELPNNEAFSGFSTFTYLNDSGTIVFMAQIAGPSFSTGASCSFGSENNALFTWSMADGFNEIVREGEILSGGGLVSEIKIAGVDSNNSGNLAFQVELDCVEDNTGLFIVPSNGAMAFSAWRLDQDGEVGALADPGDSSKTELTDRMALLAYAFGQDPSEQPIVTVEPQYYLEGDALYMNYTRIKNAADIKFSVEYSTNLEDWELAISGSDYVEQVYNNLDGTESVEIEFNGKYDSLSKFFYRLKVDLVEQL